MRFLYFILFFSLKYALRVYFRTVCSVNGPKEFLGNTIYVSNHPSSFMDPLTAASLRKPIVFFMTRSDVFTPFMKPILWASHMLPIYRQQDGEDTKKKNDEVFMKCASILNDGRNLLIFGEGFTDDIFIRRLKHVKKGAVRIGFSALEKSNWKKNIYLAAVGINYTAPNMMRSDCLVSSSDKICLNDFRDEFELNPNKVITDLTREIEKRMKEQITHIENAADAPFHESVQQITRLGMHPTSSNRKIPLIKRWRNSQKLAHFFNSNVERIHTEFLPLRKQLKDYSKSLIKKNIEDQDVIEFKETDKISRHMELFKMALLAPFAILGLIHCWPVYIIVKRFVEKSFKRVVFHGSVKLLLGMISMGFVNIPFIFLFYHFVFASWSLAILYYLLIGFYFLAMILFKGSWEKWKRKGNIQMSDLIELAEMRTTLERTISESDLNVLK